MVSIIYRKEWDNFGSKFMSPTLGSVVSMGCVNGCLSINFTFSLTPWMDVTGGKKVCAGTLPYVGWPSSETVELNSSIYMR